MSKNLCYLSRYVPVAGVPISHVVVSEQQAKNMMDRFIRAFPKPTLPVGKNHGND